MQRKSLLTLLATLAILVLLLSALPAAAEKGDPPGALPNSLSITGAAPPPAGTIVYRPPQHPDALVNDGSFENGPPPASAWTEVTNTTCEWIGDWSAVWGVAAQDGSNDFWAGGYCGGIPTTSSVSQAGIAVPATDNDLRFWIMAYRPDPDDGDNDRAYVNVNGTPVWTLPLVQASNTFPNWVEVVVPMTAYAGQNVTLEFGGISENASTGNIRFDTIRFGAPPPPPERCPAGSAEVTVLTQDFEGSFPPAGWVVANATTGCVTPGVPDWTNTNPGGRTNLTGGNGAFAIADSDACGSSSTMNAQMWTPAINLTGLTDPQITYYTDYYDISSTSDVADLDFSLDNGATWANLISWNSSHRGPLMVEQAFPAGNQPSARLRWNYTNATWDWWWEVDSVEITACEPQTNAALELNKTVGTTPGVCAVGDNITVTAGTEVYYCYQAHNTGNVTLNFHDLVDSELGVLADNLPYALAPGAYSPQVIVPDTPMASVTNTGTWTGVTALAGYTADDTIPYSFQDISGTGTAVPLTDDSMSPAIPIGFPFDYFGVFHTDVYISSNGFLTVLSGQYNGCCSGQPIPTAGDPDGLIAGWWEDLNPSAGGAVYYQTLGTAPNRVFIVQFTNVPHYSSGNDVTMQFKLFETTNVIEVHYQAAPSDGGTHSAGIENQDGTAGVQWVYGTAGLATPEAVQYAPMPVYMATDDDTATVTVLTPNIDVAPLIVNSTQPMNTSTVAPMTVANTGQGNLTWQIAEEPVARPAEPLRGGDALAAADTFDGKAPQKPAGAAPERSGWHAPEAVLYSNGPLVTHPAGGAGGANASALQTALGLDTYGFGMQLSEGNRIADDFTVTGSGWLIGAITFYGYQTGSGTTSSFTAMNLQIWDGPPDQAGSMIVFGDTTTNRLVNTQWSDIYRVLDTGLANTDRAVMANTVAVNTFLSPGTYWLDWQADGSGAYSGPWAPPVTIVGETGKPGANALQWTGAWAPAVDGGIGTPQDFPFEIEGLADCSNLADVPWLSASPSSGANGGGTSTPIDVTLDSTGLALGTYEARLCMTSNDPDFGPGNGTNLVIVPVTLEVENQCPSGAVTGALTTADPTFNRPVSGNPGCFPDPYVGTRVRYDVYSYNLTGPTPADVWASLCGSTAFDSVLIIYQAPDGSPNPFNPAQPCAYAVAYDDDWCQSQPLIDQATFGNGWIDIVVAGYANDGLGPYTLNLDSNSCNGGSAQIDVSPLAVSNGQSCMAQNTQVTQPMTVRNLGDRPLSTWAAGSAAASCVPVSAVPWLRLPEASFATAAGAASSVGVTFDSTGYAPGVYTANVCLVSNDPDAGTGNGAGLVIVPATMTVCFVPTSVALTGLAATPASLPFSLPLAALPATAGLALAAAYAVRRKK